MAKKQINMRSTICKVIILTALFFMCKLNAYTQINKVTYHLAYYFDNPAKISFDSAGNYVLYDGVCDLCLTYGRSDTISFGKYVKYKNRLYFLFSDPSVTGNRIHAEVFESETPLKDSALIIMNSPFAKLNKEELFSDGTVVVYVITIWYDNSINMDNYGTCKLKNPQSFSTLADSIVIPKPSDIPIKKIMIEAICNRSDSKKTLWYMYETKDFSSSSFVFDLKDFIYERFFYRSYFMEPIIIIDNNTIDFDRQIFQIKEKRIRRFPRGKRYYNVFNKVENPYENESE